MNWGAELGSCMSPLRLLVSLALGKLGSSGTPKPVWDTRRLDKKETEMGTAGRVGAARSENCAGLCLCS